VSDYQLFHGDCLEVMATLEAGSVDAVITDPPYGLDFHGKSWDTSIPNWLDAARMVSRLVMFTTAPTTQWEYPKPDWVNCWYRDASNSRAPSGGFNHWSPILIYGTVKFPVDSKKLHAIAHSQPSGFPHPSPKPLALMIWLIENGSNPGDVVLDPFMGSGTTGVAAMHTGRKFVGIEMDAGYFQIAKARIEKAAQMAAGEFVTKAGRADDLDGLPMFGGEQ
jgi:site-specific DNA-methyltransferase (adenine-specific)